MSDLISREALLDVIEKQKSDNDAYCRMCIDSMKEIIEEQPSVTDTNVCKWIPCSERLPNVSRCIVDIGYLMDDGKLEHEIKIVDFKRWQSGFSFEDDWCNDITKNVIAWMPLPEPYKGE